MTPSLPRAFVVLMANEPRCYPEVMGAAAQPPRSYLRIVLVEPAETDDALIHLTPDLVVCSIFRPAVRDRCPTWIVLYQDGANMALRYHARRHRMLQGVTFDYLLSIIDAMSRDLPAMPPQQAAGAPGVASAQPLS